MLSLFQNFLDEKFNGLDPADVIFLMTLPDPESSVVSKAVQSASLPVPLNGKMGFCYTYSSECHAINPVAPGDLFEAEEDHYGDTDAKATYLSDESLDNGQVTVAGYFSLLADNDGEPTTK